MNETLKQIRKSLGFTSARAFFQHLKERAPIGFNYSYYMKIEAGDVIPSPKVVNQIANLLPTGLADAWISAYCASLFPGREHLFQKDTVAFPDPVASSAAKTPERLRPDQIELSEKQVHAITATREHYFLFLLVTLARQPLSLQQLKKMYAFSSLSRIIEDLTQAQLVSLDPEKCLVAAYPEYRFPAAQTGSLKKMYEKLDEWDRQRGSFFGLKKLRRGQFFKRLSPKSVELIRQHLELLFETIRLSDETNAVHNTEVIALSVSVETGPIAG